MIAGNSYADAADPGGQIYVHRGSPQGLTAKGVLISQDSRGLLAGSVDGDGFGGSGSSDGVNTTRPTFISPDQNTLPGQEIGFGRSLN
ncbi:hypothetical protein ACIHFD_26375 [Nonomuraea sp. NPDC051941]|uniref:hypothetical protein n=1 Tax=Nonomuraea sp. NPDC051941 TaxID=3364373 RepID=UPI0037C9CC17